MHADTDGDGYLDRDDDRPCPLPATGLTGGSGAASVAHRQPRTWWSSPLPFLAVQRADVSVYTVNSPLLQAVTEKVHCPLQHSVI